MSFDPIPGGLSMHVECDFHTKKKKPIKCTYNFPTSIVQFSSHLFNYISVGCIVWILVDYKQQEYWPQTLLTQHICFLTIICSKCFVVFHMMT